MKRKALHNPWILFLFKIFNAYSFLKLVHKAMGHIANIFH